MNSKSVRALNLLAGHVLVKDMTLRDWFAGQAMLGLYTDHSVHINAAGTKAIIAEIAYDAADKMLAERAKEST